MIKPAIRAILTALIVLSVICTHAAHAEDWSDTVDVRHELQPCVSYRARLDGPFLIVKATLGRGWHTFAMDNKQRAARRLAGRRSLGVDLPTEIEVAGGLEIVGPWYQSPPKDFSKPEMRWFSWGFEDQSVWVAKVRRSGSGPARIDIRGQACTETICKNIDVAISLPFADTSADSEPSDIDLKTLIEVRRNDSFDPRP
jgi:hypothetical protein